MFMRDGKHIGKAEIKNRAVVGQDHGFVKWLNDGTIFDVYEFSGDRLECIAAGYGLLSVPNSYGNGALYVYRKDLIFKEAAPSSKPRIVAV